MQGRSKNSLMIKWQITGQLVNIVHQVLCWVTSERGQILTQREVEACDFISTLKHCSRTMLMKITRLTFHSHVHDVYVLKPCITRTSTRITNKNCNHVPKHCGSLRKHNTANTWTIRAGAKLGHASNHCLPLTTLTMLVLFVSFFWLHCTWVDHWIVVQIELWSCKTVCCAYMDRLHKPHLHIP